MRTQESHRLSVAHAAVGAGIQAHLDGLDQPIQTLIHTINDHIAASPELRQQREWLASLPGLGERTTATLLAFYAEPSRFRTARHAVAFAGWTRASAHRAAASIQAPTVQSRPRVRKALDRPAMVTLYKTAGGKRFKNRLAHAGKPAKLIIGAIRHKPLQVAVGVLKSGKHFHPTLQGA